MAKTVEMPTWAVPEAVTVSPATMVVGPQVATTTRAAQDRIKPPMAPRRASPVVRQERRRRLDRMTATGTAKVARPSMVCRGKTRIWRRTTARALRTSRVTAVVVACA